MTRSEVGLWTARGVGLGLGLLLVFIVAMVAETAADVLVLVVISVLLAASLDPLIGWVRDRSRLSRVQTIMIIYALLVVLSVALLLLVVPSAINQIETLFERAPALIQDARDWAASIEPAAVGTAVDRLINTLELATGRSGVAEPDPETIVQAGLTVADAVISVLTVLTLVFFWLISRETMQRFFLAQLAHERRGGVRRAWNQIESRMGDWLRGQLILMTSVGVITGAAYFALGLENALLLGLIAGLAEVIPIVGPAIGAIPALIVALVSGGPELALGVAIVYIIIQVLEGQILVPIVMRRSVGLPPFIVIVALLVGAAVAGLVGALLAVPLAAAVVVVMESVQARKTIVPLEPVDPAPEPEEPAEAVMDVT